tara:strand:- start:961 stop:3012 length:2052 start_codon:yes stop_codon:yes gene_type:complete
MANEFKHKTVGTQLTQTEWEAVGGHVFDSQAAGDTVYASSTTQLSRLGIGTAGKVLMVNSGASAPEWSAALTGVTSIYATDLIIGEDSQTAIDFGTTNEIDFKVDNAARLTLTTGALYPVTDNQIDLGTASLEFKDAYFDGTVTADAFAGPLTGNADTATLATTVTITDNESTNEDNAVVFTAGGDVDGGSLGLESDGNLTYNPSTGRLTATQLAGTIQTASQTNITGVGTISTGVWQGTAIASGYIAADAITGAKIADDALDSEHYTDGSIDTAHLAADAITGAKIADDAINSEHYTDGSIDTAHIADDQVTLAKMAGLTRGSLIIGDSNGDPSALAKGTANYILTSDGTDIAWAAAPDATNASHVLVTDNESTNEENLITFVEGATSSTGNVGLEMDGNLTYNPSSGTLTATAFAGALTGNVTGNASGTAATVTSGTQANITTLANLTTSGALNAGSITSGFGTIDTGSSAISTTGAVRTGDINLGHASDTTLARSATAEVTIAGTLIKKVGTENMWVPATAMTPRDNAGCASITTVAAGTNGQPDFHVLDFDKDSTEFAQFSVAMPKSWDGGNIYAYYYWIGHTDTNEVRWDIQVLSINNNEELAQGYGSVVGVTDTSLNDATRIAISDKTNAIACGGADNDLLCFQVSRDHDHADDDMDGDARLWGILFEYTTSASTDA